MFCTVIRTASSTICAVFSEFLLVTVFTTFLKYGKFITVYYFTVVKSDNIVLLKFWVM